MSTVARSVQEVIGHQLAQDLSPRQHDEVNAYIADDWQHLDGISAVARQVLIEEAAGRIGAAVPILLARLAQGQHRRRQHQAQRSLLDVVTFAEQRYQAKVKHLVEHDAYKHGWTNRDALDYAIDTTIRDRKDCGLDAIELETALRDVMGIPPMDPVGAQPSPDVLARIAELAAAPGDLWLTKRRAELRAEREAQQAKIDDDAPLVVGE